MGIPDPYPNHGYPYPCRSLTVDQLLFILVPAPNVSIYMKNNGIYEDHIGKHTFFVFIIIIFSP